MRTVTVVVPTYNEEKNIEHIYERVGRVFELEIPNYQMELLFIDNASSDGTREHIRALCDRDSRVQAIFNATNFGFAKSSFYGLSQAEGDCAIMLYADMQDPPEMIPQFVAKWEEGYQIVAGIKYKSKENKIVYALRGIYYKILAAISEIEHIQQFDGFGLYDASFISTLRKIEDPLPYLRGMVAEFGGKRVEVEYVQEKRKEGKTSFNLMRYYDFAMLGITSSTKAIMRIATMLGGIMSAICMIIAIVTMILKITNWQYYDVGTAAIIIGIFFVGAIQIFFLGFLGEYILNINIRVMKHPIVVEEERINLKRFIGNKMGEDA